MEQGPRAWHDLCARCLSLAESVLSMLDIPQGADHWLTVFNPTFQMWKESEPLGDLLKAT